VNFNRWDLMGFQGAGIANVTLERVTGVQAAGIFNLSREATGFQGAGISNVALGHVRGFQGAGIAAVATGDVHGFQGAGIANVTHGGVRGLQVAGIANVATSEVTGAQIGLVNYGGKVKGAQIGLINIATEEMKGAPIGLFNYAGDGIFAPTFWMADSAMLNWGLKTGSKHVYGIFGGGAHPVKQERLSLVAGIGGHIELVHDLWLELDLLHNALRGRGDRFGDAHIDVIEQARVNLGYRFGNQFSVYVGPSLNLLVSEAREEVGLIPPLFSSQHGDTNVALSVGLTAGIQWEPRFGRVNLRK
jgi:hypothetical protein